MELENADKVITEFLNSLGPWRDHVIIGGGYALIIYKLYLTDQKHKNPPLGTRDIDSLISRKTPEISKKNIAKHLLDAGFKNFFKDVNIPAAEAYVKAIKGEDVEIEFLTDDAVRNDKNKNVVISGIVAQPLSYLTLSLQKTIPFQTYSNQKGRVVSPGAWMFHKCLTFTKRKGSLKKLKDLYGIWYLATQLGDFSDLAVAEFNNHALQNPKWFNTVKKNLLNWMENVSPVEWEKLETQDPSGKLKKLSFEKVMKKIALFEEI